MNRVSSFKYLQERERAISAASGKDLQVPLAGGLGGGSSVNPKGKALLWYGHWVIPMGIPLDVSQDSLKMSLTPI